MHLYLIRHGQSQSAVPSGAGGGNADLSDAGREQAEATGRALVGAGIGVVLASPLTRALRTAHLIAAHLGASVEAWPELAEADRRAWDLPKKKRDASQRVGLTTGEVSDQFPGTEVVGFSGDEPWWLTQGTEGRRRTYKRAKAVVKRIRKRWAKTDESVALITHGTFGSVLIAVLCEAAPTSFNRFSQDTCGISRFEIAPKETRLRFLNRIDHLPAELRTDLA